ncbi:MAG: hypothetical protein LUO93_05995 [Methanomicrobiales archaeon]|nr:hypothetical protein [Methanomicrobiales archaeon]
MFNKILYAIFKNPTLVRLAKGAIAVAASSVCAFLVKELGDTSNTIPDIIVLIGTPLLLAADKFFQTWRASAT